MPGHPEPWPPRAVFAWHKVTRSDMVRALLPARDSVPTHGVGSRSVPETELTDDDRARLIAALMFHLADERLTLEEYEARAEVVHEAQTMEEAAVVLAGLPGPGADGVAG